MRQSSFAIALSVALATGGPLQAQNVGDMLEPLSGDEISRVGTRGANFLQIGVGARAMALGGAGTTLGSGLSSLYWNTAAIAGVEGPAIGVSTADLYANSGLSHTFAGIVIPIGDGALAASVSYFSSGEIERTTEAYPEGNDPTFGAVIEWSGTAIALHYARRITDRLSVGVAGKFVEEGIDLASANYLGFDVGALFDVGVFGLTLGAAVTNVGTEGRFEGGVISAQIPEERETFDAAGDRTVRHDTDDMQLPTALHFSVRSSLLGPPEALLQPNANHDLRVYAQVLDAIDTNIQTSLGIEYGFRNRFFVRGGKRFMNESQAPWDFSDGLSGGLGIRWPLLNREIAFDYAYVSMGLLRHTQLFSLEFGF